MHEQLWFTAILNHLFGPALTGLLEKLGIHPHFPQAPISNSAAMEILVCFFLIVIFFIVRAGLSVDRPGALQHTFEGLVGFIEQQSQEIIGPHSEGYTPFLLPLALLSPLSDLIGLITGLDSPPAAP